MAGQELIRLGRELPVPAHPAVAAVVMVVKLGSMAIGGLMLLGWATNTKSETEFEFSPKNGVKFKHKTDKREDDKQ